MPEQHTSQLTDFELITQTWINEISPEEMRQVGEVLPPVPSDAPQMRLSDRCRRMTTLAKAMSSRMESNLDIPTDSEQADRSKHATIYIEGLMINYLNNILEIEIAQNFSPLLLSHEICLGYNFVVFATPNGQKPSELEDKD